MRHVRGALVAITLIGSCALVAQEVPPSAADPASESLRYFYAAAKRNILRGAEKMPEGDYAYRPTPEVRSFGQLVAHIADAQFLFCSSARNEPNPNGANLGPGDASDAIEKGGLAKAELVAALRRAFEYCDPAIQAASDAAWKEPATVVKAARQRSVPLMLTIVHLWEHYGNMVTYLRLKGIVPPSSEPRTP